MDGAMPRFREWKGDTPMRRKVWSAVLTALCVGLTATAWAGPSNLVTNGSFEEQQVSAKDDANPGGIWLPAGSDYLTGWTIVSGSVDLVRSGSAPSDGYQSLDLNGNEAGIIEQIIHTAPGAWYLLQFDMAGNPVEDPLAVVTPADKTMDVLWGPDVVMSPDYNVKTMGSSNYDMRWTTLSVLLQATTDQTTLGFRSTTMISRCGPMLDNVRLYPVPAVPEPGALAMLGGMLIAPAGWLLRRRRAA
jgi:choice-of-anchor C domain-containing protein